MKTELSACHSELAGRQAYFGSAESASYSQAMRASHTQALRRLDTDPPKMADLWPVL
jgi:hypothetical protein